MTRIFRCGLFCLALAAMLLALPAAAFADGIWVTTDKGCKVWNSLGISDHTATWTGAADADGYATGKGILQWYANNKPLYKYEGEMLKGKREGQGTETFASSAASFAGTWRGDKMHGRGVYRMENGDIYDGNWVEGFRTGRGTLTCPNGDRYEGEWLKGERNGKGIFAWANGDRYEGDFKNNDFAGRGVFTGANGDRYEGDWANGKLHGKGTYWWANGIRYEGEWANGAMNGYGVCYFTNGAVQKGQWANGKFVGDKTK